MTHKAKFRIVLGTCVALILAGLLMWQHVRYKMVETCLSSGGHWDGANSLCRPLPRIYLERGLKRT